jgi:Ca-activated chloride channel family protein
MRLIAAAVLCSVLAAVRIVTVSSADAGQQAPFKSGARTVAIYATVTDGQGRLVPDLAREDFEIYDNGRPQPITIFSNDIQPITVVMMLDRSGSMQGNFKLVEMAGEAFVRRLLPADKARIGSFAAKIQIDPEDFTADQQSMIRILRSELQAAGPTPLWNAADEAITSLLPQDGRRVVLLFTDGVDSPMNFKVNNRSVMDVMERAQRQNVMVYAVGLESAGPQAPLGGRGGFGGGGFGGGGFGGGGVGQGPDPGLPTIAEETGGGYFELRRAEDLSSAFARVADELHRQYALGFEPAKLDDKMHKLQVKIRKPGMKVRARKNYHASPEGR